MSTTSPAVADGGTAQVDCWCCGARDTADRMVQLGLHPEVHLCPRCAHSVHHRAGQIDDRDRHGPGVLARDRLRDARALVIRRGWHRNRFVGGALQRLGRHLP